jgi:hypothetical protein
MGLSNQQVQGASLRSKPAASPFGMEKIMKQVLWWGVVFAVVALLMAPFIAPLLFHGSNMRKLGATAFPFLVLVGGSSGIVFGIMRSRNKK